MSNQELSLPLQKIGFCLGAFSAMAPGLIFKFSTPMMYKWEEETGIALMVLGALLGYFLTARRTIVGLLIFPVAFFGVSFLCWNAFFTIRELKVATLRPRLADYTNFKFERQAGDANRDLRIKGKIVAVDLNKRIIDPIHLLLPDELRADKPDEVGIVLQLSWGEEPVGRYPRGGMALRRFCVARIIEYSGKHRLLHEERFYGGGPPDRGSSSDLYGQPPYSEIIEFLKTHSSI